MVKIIKTTNPDGSFTEHIINSIEQNNILKKRLDELQRQRVKENWKDFFNALISFGILITVMALMYWFSNAKGVL